LHDLSGGTYARQVEPAEVEQAVQAERAVRAPVHDSARAHGPDAPGQAIGNRALGRVLSRMRDGDGILDGGVVHPDVESAIAMASGAGRPLDNGVAARLAPSMGEAVDGVRVHAGEEAAQLARAVSARAFTVGSDIFFGAGEYRPGTPDGDQLIAHEAAHVVQQQGAPAGGPLTVSQPGDALEREAEAFAHELPA
jgi:hypothetical protein